MITRSSTAGAAVCTTNKENPWLIITLPKTEAVAEVEIVNRQRACQEFARTLTLWLSTDKKTWQQVWRDPQVQSRWRVRLPRHPRARYLKLGLQEKQYLNLKYVYVYGPGQ